MYNIFQFQIIDGEYKETDISGTCNVSYESVSTEVFRKTKVAVIILCFRLLPLFIAMYAGQ